MRKRAPAPYARARPGARGHNVRDDEGSVVKVMLIAKGRPVRGNIVHELVVLREDGK